jgi:hypothetical protein
MKLSRPVGLAVAVSLIAGTVAAIAQISGAAPADPTANVVDAAGHLRVPADYRTLYQALGSWAIAADSGEGSKEMHTVYASPGAIDAYRKTGHFRDGAVLVKEVFATSTNEMTTGTVSHADKLKGWFVMVKDSKGTHPDNPLWGDGWGWSWFDADKPVETTSTEYHSDCMGATCPPRPPAGFTRTDIPSCVTRRPHAQCSALAQSRAGTNGESDKLVRQAGRLKGFL